MSPFSPSATEDTLKPTISQRRPPLTFFMLVFALTIPFGVIGILSGIQLIPGIPLTALAVFSPAIAAAILVRRENGTSAVTALLWRSFDYKRINAKVWYIPIVFLPFGVAVLRDGLMGWMEMSPPALQISVLSALVMSLMFFVFALGEELGWSGYVIDPLQDRWTALQASVLVGVVWAVWHIPLMVQLGQSPALIGWGCLNMVGTRILLVWLYNNTGKSVFAIALCHALLNVSSKILFSGNSYTAGVISSLLIATMAVIVTVVWEPRTLATFWLSDWIRRSGRTKERDRP